MKVAIVPLLLIVLLCGILVPMVSLAQEPLVPCGINGPDCDFDDLVDLARRVINFLLGVAVPIAAIMFAYAGFLYLTSAGDTAKRGKATSIFQNVFWGFVLALSAWLIVNLLTTFFLEGNKNPENIFSRHVTVQKS